MVDAMEEQIMAEIAAQIAAGNAVACPLPTEATDFLYWPWIWRGAQVLLLTALAWQFWPAAEKISRVLLYLAAAATLVGTFVQVQKNSSASPEGGGWWRRWHAAVRQYPERFSGPLWLATGLLAGAGFYIASRGIDPGRSLNAFVEKFDALLIVLLSFVHFRFTVARRQPFWLMGLLAESWLIGLSAIGVLLLSVYLARFGWGALLRGGAHGPLTGWSMGYGTAFSHWMVLAGLLAAGRAAADPLFRTAAADPVIAAATGLTAPASATLPGEPSHP
ncbi:MAG: hypothetical protein ACREJ2_05170, partial [Planctomycetota bacterium]